MNKRLYWLCLPNLCGMNLPPRGWLMAKAHIPPEDSSHKSWRRRRCQIRISWFCLGGSYVAKRYLLASVFVRRRIFRRIFKKDSKWNLESASWCGRHQATASPHVSRQRHLFTFLHFDPSAIAPYQEQPAETWKSTRWSIDSPPSCSSEASLSSPSFSPSRPEKMFVEPGSWLNV